MCSPTLTNSKTAAQILYVLNNLGGRQSQLASPGMHIPAWRQVPIIEAEEKFTALNFVDKILNMKIKSGFQ